MKTPSPSLVDTKLDTKIVLSGLWISMLFVFAYVDIFGFWRADVIQGALDKTIPGPGFAIDQRFLVVTTVYILLPSLMVVASLLLAARTNRIANLTLSAAYAVTIVGSMVGESWVYYLLGSIIELLLLAAIFRIAWAWPRADESPSTRP